MEIKQISVKFGMTQNLGDYTNCRPEVGFMAVLSSADDVGDVIAELDGLATDHIHHIIDDELEAAGRKVKYYNGQLYQVAHNDARKCIVVYPSNTILPDESTWKTKDRWPSRNHPWPQEMRVGTADRLVAELHQSCPGYKIVKLPHDLIPPMPDDGPEPAWHAKDLQHRFKSYLQIPEEFWVELGELDHVDNDYLQELYNHNIENEPLEERLAIIRENRPLETELEDYDDDDYQDYDEEVGF